MGKNRTRGNKKSGSQVRQQARTKRSNSSTIILISALAGLVVLTALFLINRNARAVGDIQGVQVFTNLDRSHTTGPVTYDQLPPAGGPHNPQWQNCGVYTEPVPNENAVHSLEHGVIWITYQPDLPADQLERLQALTRQSSYRLLSPYPGLPNPIVASAWGYQLQLESADDARLLDFIRKYEQNPQGPEPGASCAGGVGQPG